ncbi:MAG: hypothetical protein FWH36_06355 [Lentimicrobiaceae bacterium]|nr:hypothetical protein [Lentimicrobiaceae bacterium]
MRPIRVLSIFVILILTSVFSTFAQSTEKIMLVFYQSENYGSIAFPCRNISTCIDTLYNKGDTLSIRLIDNRIFYLDTAGSVRTPIYRRVIICDANPCIYAIKAKTIKRQLNIPITEPKYRFIEMQIYDKVCLLEKTKNRYVLKNSYDMENKAIAEILQKNAISTYMLVIWSGCDLKK